MEEVVGELIDIIVAIDDQTVSLILQLRSPLLTKVLTSVTGLGSAAAAVVFLGFFGLAGWEDELLIATVALVLTGVVVGVLMQTVQRPFPPAPVCMTGDAGTIATSFPSGHAAAVVVFAMTARQSPRLPFGVVAGLAATVSFSRVYLGTHYLSDTVAGVAIGVLAFAAAKRLVDRSDFLSRARPVLD